MSKEPVKQPTMIVCPKCSSQLEVRVTFASGPKSSTPAFQADDTEALLEQAEARTLTQWEYDFIHQLRERYAQYGSKILLSDKQRTTLRNIASGEDSR